MTQTLFNIVSGLMHSIFAFTASQNMFPFFCSHLELILHRFLSHFLPTPFNVCPSKSSAIISSLFSLFILTSFFCTYITDAWIYLKLGFACWASNPYAQMPSVSSTGTKIQPAGLCSLASLLGTFSYQALQLLWQVLWEASFNMSSSLYLVDLPSAEATMILFYCTP